MLFGITDPELLILDEFEDFEYQRTTVDVSLMVTQIEFESPSLLDSPISQESCFSTARMDGHACSLFLLCFMQDTADKLQVQAYIWTNKNDPNLYGDWDFEVNSSSSSSSSYVSSIMKCCYPFCIMK